MKETQQSIARKVAIVGIMAGVSNILALIALPGPLNIQFGLTAIPIYLVSFSLGPIWGAICGLIGGIMQAGKYGHFAYILYTAIQGGVAGYFAFHQNATRKWTPLFALIGGFFLIFWVDLLRGSEYTLKNLSETGFLDASKIFGMEINIPIPLIGIIGAVTLLAVSLFFIKKKINKHSLEHLTLAGIFGAIAYVPYDAIVLYILQGYPWLPTWFVLSKDLVQDFIAAGLCAALFQNKRLVNLLFLTKSNDI